KSRFGADELCEAWAIDGQGQHLTVGDDGSRARRVVEQSHLAEVVAGLEQTRAPIHPDDLRLALEQDVERLAGVARPNHGRARREAANVRELRDPPQLTLRQAGEQRNLAERAEPVVTRLARGGGSCSRPAHGLTLPRLRADS